MAIYSDLATKIEDYIGSGATVVLFLCALLFWLVASQKSKEMKFYVLYLVVGLLAVLNPLSLYLIDLSGNMDVYERFFWLLMTPVMLSVSFAYLSQKHGKYMGIALAILLLLCGNSVFTKTEYKPAENVLKISQQAIEVSDIIMRDYERLPEDAKVIPNRRMEREDCPRVFATEPISEDIRMYNANILLYYVRKNFGSYDKEKFHEAASLVTMETSEIPAEVILKQMKKRKFTYLVLGDWQSLEGDINGVDLSIIGQTENYRVYKYNPTKKYTVTQYADVNDYQCMSYLIESSNGDLVVVDGGRAWQSIPLTDIIKEKGGYVDTWIITHPHDDHCGVLASVLEAGWDQNGEISIGRILIGYMNYEDVKHERRSDGFGYLLNGLNNRDNVSWLYEGDELDVIGLHMKVLHSCNETVLAHSQNIMNDGGMVFKLSAAKKSMLFLADVGDNNQQTAEQITDPAMGSEMGRRIADEILANFPEDVKATYVQMSHHGNGSLPDYFYEAISPKVAFFDAPDWLMKNVNRDTGLESYYATPHYAELMGKLGAKIISYSSARRSVVLK